MSRTIVNLRGWLQVLNCRIILKLRSDIEWQENVKVHFFKVVPFEPKVIGNITPINRNVPSTEIETCLWPHPAVDTCLLTPPFLQKMYRYACFWNIHLHYPGQTIVELCSHGRGEYFYKRYVGCKDHKVTLPRVLVLSALQWAAQKYMCPKKLCQIHEQFIVLQLFLSFRWAHKLRMGDFYPLLDQHFFFTTKLPQAGSITSEYHLAELRVCTKLTPRQTLVSQSQR